MKIVIEFNKGINLNNKEGLKRLIDREDFNNRLKTAVDNERGLSAENSFGRWIYTIRIVEGRSDRR